MEFQAANRTAFPAFHGWSGALTAAAAPSCQHLASSAYSHQQWLPQTGCTTSEPQQFTFSAGTSPGESSSELEHGDFSESAFESMLLASKRKAPPQGSAEASARFAANSCSPASEASSSKRHKSSQPNSCASSGTTTSFADSAASQRSSSGELGSCVGMDISVAASECEGGSPDSCLTELTTTRSQPDELLMCGEDLFEDGAGLVDDECDDFEDIMSLLQRDTEANNRHTQILSEFDDADPELFSPDDVVPEFSVPSHCFIARLAEQYNFSKYAIALGTSYFRRLCERDTMMQAAAWLCPDFHDFAGMPQYAEVLLPQPQLNKRTVEWLTAIHLTCIYLACKATEGLPYKHLLPTMLSHLRGQRVTTAQAMTLELNLLEALEWRLGPHLSTQSSDDECYEL